MRKPSVLLAWLVFSLVVMFSMSVEAYEFLKDEPKWPSPAATFRVDISGAGGADGLWNTAFETAMARWNDATIFEFRIVRDTFEDPCDGVPNLISNGDDENGVAFTDDICGDAFGAEALAYTKGWTIEDSITQANIFFNKAVDWDVHGEVHDGNIFGPTSAKDFRRVAVHELGHALGLDHEDDVPAIMSTDYSGIQVLVTPQCDDIAGVRALYQNEDEDWPCPINYSSSDATWISGPSGRVTGSNVNATDQTDEPAALGSRSVWWEWRPPSDGTLTVDTAGSSFDTTLGVYELTYVYAAFDKTRLAENDDAAGNQSRVTLYVTEGKPYMLRVAGYGGATGDIVLNWDLSQAPPQSSESESFSIPNLGGWSVTSDGTEAATKMGYGRIRADAGSTTPSGIAIFGLRQGGVLVSEAGVPATEAVREGRIFAEVNGPVNTGLAIANPNDAPATIDFYFTDTGGNRFGEGRYELRAHEQIAKFLSDAPFNSGSAVLGTFTFTSSAPIAVVALRGLTNQADEFLMTTLPVAPLSSAATASTDTVYFPHFADGSGWATEVILVNPTDATITGTVRFLGPGSGAMTASRATLTLDDGRTESDFAYSIPPRSSQKFTTSNPSRPVSSGSVRAIPNQGSAAPSGLVVFSYTTPGGKTVSESGVSALPAGSAFRVYAELSGTPGRMGSIRTGLAIVNTADTSTTVTLELTELDGTLAAPPATLSLPPSGQVALFLDEIIVSRPGHYSGVLRVTSTADVAIVGLRLRINERGELKMTTTPPSEETGASTTADRFFPHFVDSAGWSTQFILFSGTAGGASSGTLGFIDPQGAPLDLPVAPTETVPPAEVPDAETDRQALEALYDATGGPTWTRSANWKTEAPLRQWYGVTTNADGRVTKLILLDNELSGTIPAELGNLTNLQVLAIAINGLSGTIPAELGNLTNLQYLDLRLTGLSGPIPAELGNLTNLQELLLSFNQQLSGPIPAELGNLTNLQVLDLTDIGLTGQVPAELGKLTNLRELALSNNRLTGQVPAQLGNLTNLQVLRLSYNRLTGQVPAELGKLTNLRELALSNNRLTGQVPAELGKLTNLRKLFLYNNELTGTLPSSLMNLEGISAFWFDGNAGLCAPLTGVFQDWLFGNYYTPRGRGPMCEPESGGNRPPRAVGTIPTQTLTVDGPPASLSLGQFFRDPDGDQLTYSGYFNFGSRVTAQLSGETLLITPLTAGKAVMLIIARDSEGLRAEHKINVVVLPTPPPGIGPDLVLGPDLVVQNPSSSDSSLTVGASFTFGVTVRNQGTSQAAATILRYYRSSDDAISANDTEVGTDAVGSLPASGSSDESISLTAPSSAGTYYYYACVDESDRANNNCSSAVEVVVIGVSSGAGKMYWTDSLPGKIQRANLDGSGVEDLVTSGLGRPGGLALDPGAGKMYWTDYGTDKIQRANLDGSGVEDLVTSGLSLPSGLALDPGAGKMYWMDDRTDKIQRANLDGSGVEDLVTSGLSGPYGLALDPGAGKMYWTDYGTDKIQRANLDGSGVEDLVTSGLGTPLRLALDPGAGKMYWTDSLTDKIQRANLDGSRVEDLVTSGLGGPAGLALDPGAGKMYWTDFETDKIQRANLDGSGVEDLVTSGLGEPTGLALDTSGAGGGGL